MASGRTRVASVPALYASNCPPLRYLRSPSAICDRAELWVQMKRIRCFMSAPSRLPHCGVFFMHSISKLWRVKQQRLPAEYGNEGMPVHVQVSPYNFSTSSTVVRIVQIALYLVQSIKEGTIVSQQEMDYGERDYVGPGPSFGYEGDARFGNPASY